MSKYQVFPDIRFRDPNLLIKALDSMGYDHGEVGDSLPLYGYRGDERPERAQIVIRRSQLGPVSNDIGFTQTDDGFVPIISEFDNSPSGPGGGNFLARLRATYGEQVVNEVARRVHGSVTRQQEGQLTKLRVAF